MAHRGKDKEVLNAAQRKAVNHNDGPMLVLAGAGSGKTKVVTHRIARLMAEGLADASRILAVTFTNKAAGEMRARVSSLAGSDTTRELTICTFHSFCLRVLRADIESLGHRKSFTISGEGDSRTLLKRVLRDLDGMNEDLHPGILKAEISLMKGSVSGSATWTSKSSLSPKYSKWLPEVYERYESALRAANALDFDDLLLMTLRLFQKCPEVLEKYRGRFKYVVVDEYQDTNPVQYEIVRALVKRHSNLFVVGDDDQSIYGWRGADLRNILEFAKDYPAAKVVALEQNYRSTKTILDAANAVIGNNTHRHPKRMTSALGKGRPIDWLVTGDEEHEAKMAAAWYERIQSETGATPSDFAILYRSNVQSRPIEIAFRRAGIPYTVVGGHEFFDRAEVKDILAYLKLIANPRDEASFLRIVNVPRRGIGDATLHAIHDMCRKRKISLGKAMAEALKQAQVPKGAQNGIRTFLGLVSEFRSRFREEDASLSGLISELIERIDYRGEIGRATKTQEQMMMRWDNVMSVAKAADDYESSVSAPSLAGFLDETSLASDDGDRSEDDKGYDAVTLMTIHGSKGLEFPFVFIVGVEEGLLPHMRNGVVESLDEERRLFYVALTRAKRHVTLFEALMRRRQGRDMPTTPSRFLREIPEDLVRQRLHASRDSVNSHFDSSTPKAKKKKAR